MDCVKRIAGIALWRTSGFLFQIDFYKLRLVCDLTNEKMLKNINILGNFCRNSLKNRDFIKSINKWRDGEHLKTVNCDSCCLNQKMEFHSSVPRMTKEWYERRQQELLSVKKSTDTGTLGEGSIEMDSLISRLVRYRRESFLRIT